ncbi:Scr1 family TA system antitoxin-like transcriptional regulator [Saccharopolyspora sp. ID03-671]|uniref:helix-turn-helix domain-containing protein n=1 Tax=Saccharopolyspora sp. ID03-671 TaxID=3073066 RepID=UPI0032558383
MAVTTGATTQALTLGARLRELRQDRGWSLRAFAQHLGYSHHVSLQNWETGKRSPDTDTVNRILGALGVNGTEADEVLQLARETGAPQWLAVRLGDRARQLEALLKFESEATRIVDVSPLLVPGLLQTSGYARALMTEVGVADHEIESRVRMRWGRREVIDREKRPAELVTFIGEAALRSSIGGTAVMAEQLQHLINSARREHITVRVIPSCVGWHPALEGAFLLLESDASYSKIVHIENRRAGLFFHEPDDVAAYTDAVDRMSREEVAMSPEASAEFIAGIITELEKTE